MCRLPCLLILHVKIILIINAGFVLSVKRKQVKALVELTDALLKIVYLNPLFYKHLGRESKSLSVDVCLMVFNATFNNYSVISWRSVLLVEETRVPGGNHRPAASH